MTDAIVAAAEFLAGQIEYARHQAWADEFLTDVQACARIMAELVRGPQPQKYLGPCGAVHEHGPECTEGLDLDHGPDCDCCGCNPDPSDDVCDGDVYGRAGAQTGTCRTCGATVDQGERRAWLDDEVRQRAFTAKEIADAYRINVKNIRSWAADRPETGHYARLFAKAWDADGRPLYNVGDVLDLAAGDAARREEARATRARRKEQAA